MEDFLRTQGCESSMEEVAAFLKEQQAKTGELADNELDNVAGGCNGMEAAVSVCSAGLGCVAAAIESKKGDKMKGPNGQILCAG